MSVLTVAGSGIPDATFRDREYSQPSLGRLSLNPGPSSIPQNYSYTRPERRSTYNTLAQQAPQSLSQSSHHHSRTISSQAVPSPLPKPTRSAYPTHSRQSSAASINMSIQRQPTVGSMNSGLPRRSTSGRSTATNTPTSYVALMRKQKATVWCDRAQNIDPRLAAAQKIARQRAHLEVSSHPNSAGSGRTSTVSSGGLPSKIRHGGVPKAPAYVPANLSGAGVPMRLSANEMLGDEEEHSSIRGDNAMVHGRESGSGKSSASSAKYRSGYPKRPDAGRFSSTSTPPSGNDAGSPASRDRIPEETSSHDIHRKEYFASTNKPGSDSEDSFGDFKDMAAPNSKAQAFANAKAAEDLRRRGSVDERAMSMGAGVKLFVANPDLDN